MDSTNIKKSLKVTSLFGGVQFMSILVSVIRTKLVAILIGPAGIGIVELYNSTIKLLTSLTDFSLSVSAVRDVAIAYKSGDENKFSHVISLFSRIVWITGLLGTFLCILGAPLWSRLTFGNYDYTIGFVVLSSTLLFTQLKTGKSVILQATENFRYMALSGIVGNVLGLLTTIPIYYMWGVDGIVVVLLCVSIIPYATTTFYTSKLNLLYDKIGLKDVLKEGKVMLKQGFFLSINFLFSSLIFYIVRIVISNNGGIAELGLYSSSFVIINTYVGMIFQSMSQEYYPRISALSNKHKEFNEAINSQIYLSLLILGPMVICFLALNEKLLIILYSEKFIGANILMSLSMLGVLFQTPSWCMGYAFLSKGDNKLYFFYETIAKIQRLITDIVFYLLWGLTGLGLSFCISYIYYSIQSIVICKSRYGVIITRNIYTLLFVYLFLGGSLFLSKVTINSSLFFIFSLFIVFLSVYFSYRQLNKIFNIVEFIKCKILKVNE